jgi:hypothetical protein
MSEPQRGFDWPSFLLGWNLLGWIVIFAHMLGAAQ